MSVASRKIFNPRSFNHGDHGGTELKKFNHEKHEIIISHKGTKVTKAIMLVGAEVLVFAKNANITKKYECLELYRIRGTDGTSTFLRSLNKRGLLIEARVS